jgi:hypothetical protein
METAAMSNSFRREFGAYIRTRFPPWLAVSLPLFLTIAAMTHPRPTTLPNFLGMYGLAILLVFEFRVWDDIADQSRDRVIHPERVLCQITSIQSFVDLTRILVALSFVITINLDLMLPSNVLVSLLAGLAVWYALRVHIPWMPVLNYHVVLLKYPCFVLILGTLSGQSPTPGLFNSAILVYLSLCVFEVVHDRGMRELSAARVLMIVEFVLAMLLIFIVH